MKVCKDCLYWQEIHGQNNNVGLCKRFLEWLRVEDVYYCGSFVREEQDVS